MAYTAPPTFSVGQKLTASQANQLSTGITELQAAVGQAFGALTFSGTLALTTATYAELTFPTTERLDGCTTSGSRLIVPSAGWYVVSVSATFAANATGSRRIYLCTTGTVAADTRIGSSAATIVNGNPPIVAASAPVYLAANTPLSALVWQDSGGSLNVTAGRISAARMAGQ